MFAHTHTHESLRRIDCKILRNHKSVEVSKIEKKKNFFRHL